MPRLSSLTSARSAPRHAESATACAASTAAVDVDREVAPALFGMASGHDERCGQRAAAAAGNDDSPSPWCRVVPTVHVQVMRVPRCGYRPAACRGRRSYRRPDEWGEPGWFSCSSHALANDALGLILGLRREPGTQGCIPGGPGVIASPGVGGRGTRRFVVLRADRGSPARRSRILTSDRSAVPHSFPALLLRGRPQPTPFFRVSSNPYAYIAPLPASALPVMSISVNSALSSLWLISASAKLE